MPAVGDDPEDGAHLAYLHEVAADGGTVTFDIAQWFTGAEADAAYAEDSSDSTGAPNDYYIRNDSSDLRTLPVATEEVAVAWDRQGLRQRVIRIEDFAEYRAERGAGLAPFWITIESGVVIRIAEQYVP